MESRPYAANRIVGRDGELQRLAGVLGAGDGARVALVGGEAGIGKTRLVSDALASSTPSGALVIALRGDPVRAEQGVRRVHERRRGARTRLDIGAAGARTAASRGVAPARAA